MREGPEDRKDIDWRVPKPGDIVKLKSSIDSFSFLALGLRRAGQKVPEMDKRYRVKEYIKNEHQRSLRLEEVRRTRVAGKTFISPTGGDELYLGIDLFEPEE